MIVSEKPATRAALALTLTASFAFLAIACSSSSRGNDSGEDDDCAEICSCVVSVLGASAQAQCTSECDQAAASSNPRAECESRLDANGAGTCKSHCAKYPTGSGGLGGSGGSSGSPAQGIECTSESSDTCTCEADSSSPNDETCKKAEIANHICCGDSEWPNSGSCTCTLGLQCAPLDPGASDPGCFCVGSTSFSEVVLGFEMDNECSEATGNTCCLNEAKGTCACYEGKTCEAGETNVMMCAGNVPLKCPTGDVERSTCR
jgi:hypothetical protein